MAQQYQINHETGNGIYVSAVQITEVMVSADPEKFPAEQIGFWLIIDPNKIESRVPDEQFKVNYSPAPAKRG